MDTYIFSTYFLLTLSVVLIIIVFYLLLKRKVNDDIVVDTKLINDVLQLLVNFKLKNDKYSKIVSDYRHHVNGALQIINFGTSMLSRELRSIENKHIEDSTTKINNSVKKIISLSRNLKEKEKKIGLTQISLNSLILQSINTYGSSKFHKLLSYEEDIVYLTYSVEFLLRVFFAYFLSDLSHGDCSNEPVSIKFHTQGGFLNVFFIFENNVDFKNLRDLYDTYSESLVLFNFTFKISDKNNTVSIIIENV